MRFEKELPPSEGAVLFFCAAAYPPPNQTRRRYHGLAGTHLRRHHPTGRPHRPTAGAAHHFPRPLSQVGRGGLQDLAPRGAGSIAFGHAGARRGGVHVGAEHLQRYAPREGGGAWLGGYGGVRGHAERDSGRGDRLGVALHPGAGAAGAGGRAGTGDTSAERGALASHRRRHCGDLSLGHRAAHALYAALLLCVLVAGAGRDAGLDVG